ncbi:ArsR/SmtB family transcription factor [Streptomyces boncukensis]|uniref:Metalloregulator ArsR/SmtB family transcription factor n=1 Tax=Streptomyces boncukensis TaxID=2711219 RepID=A0A6G4XAN1_9ACTN|nr:metalloregulator ArsR/SmtB family transcription factor [Streptomyces boncukensis]NGO73804.1 metalloregulator ArsR/SmtB family transcription factor [Streptomyces boncukensis]
MDEVFKALADPSRRRLLDRLHGRSGQSLRELGEGLEMSRQAVSKHLAVLEEARLVTVVRRGREKLHYLNPVPVNEIAERWIGRYSRSHVRALSALKETLEGATMSATEFVYVTVIRTTPERLWEALTSPEFIRRYHGNTGPESDWEPGSAVRWKMSPDGEYADHGQRVLEAEPGRKLAYTWHGYTPEIAAMFGWSDEKLAELRRERISKVTFEIEPAGEGAVKLTVTHDDFEPGSEMLKGVSEGWPVILSNLKTLLETGETLPLES